MVSKFDTKSKQWDEMYLCRLGCLGTFHHISTQSDYFWQEGTRRCFSHNVATYSPCIDLKRRPGGFRGSEAVTPRVACGQTYLAAAFVHNLLKYLLLWSLTRFSSSVNISRKSTLAVICFTGSYITTFQDLVQYLAKRYSSPQFTHKFEPLPLWRLSSITAVLCNVFDQWTSLVVMNMEASPIVRTSYAETKASQAMWIRRSGTEYL